MNPKCSQVHYMLNVRLNVYWQRGGSLQVWPYVALSPLPETLFANVLANHHWPNKNAVEHGHSIFQGDTVGNLHPLVVH
jgi:hypothetical protein